MPASCSILRLDGYDFRHQHRLHTACVYFGRQSQVHTTLSRFFVTSSLFNAPAVFHTIEESSTKATSTHELSVRTTTFRPGEIQLSHYIGSDTVPSLALAPLFPTAIIFLPRTYLFVCIDIILLSLQHYDLNRLISVKALHRLAKLH